MTNVVKFPTVETVFEVTDPCPECEAQLAMLVVTAAKLTSLYCPACGTQMRVKPQTEPPEAA